MSTWIVIGVLALGTLAFKVVGPLLAGGRQPPPVLVRIIGLLAPALIAALIVTGALADGRRLVLDARLAGLGVGALALWLKAPLWVALVLAAGTCALVRWVL